MSARRLQPGRADVRPDAWDVNGEYIVQARRRGAEVILTVSDARSRELQHRAEQAIEACARTLGIFIRTEGSIDSVLTYIDGDPSGLIADLASQRFTASDYERLTVTDGEHELLRQVAAAGGTLPIHLVDDSAAAERLPLGHRVRCPALAPRPRRPPSGAAQGSGPRVAPHRARPRSPHRVDSVILADRHETPIVTQRTSRRVQPLDEPPPGDDR
jgi:hypothetical protein